MIIAIVSLFIILFWFLRNEFRKLQLAWNFPGPKALPFIGNGLELVNKSSLEFVTIIKQYIVDHGKFLRVWLGNQLVVVLTDPKDVQVVMTDIRLISKSLEYKYIEPWLGTGLLTSTNKKWTTRRKILTPAFHFKILDDFIEVFDKQGNILVEKLKDKSGKNSFDIFPPVALSALDIICETAMGIKLNSQRDTESQYVKNVNELADIIHHRSYDFISRYEFLFKYTKSYKRQQELVKSLHNFTESVIRKRRKELENRNVYKTEEKASEFGERNKKALLDLLLNTSVEGEPLSDEDIREECDTFIFEGHDTTASGIAFALYNIALHQDIQRKCYEEIQSILGQDGKVNMKSLNDLKYLEMVIKESLRLYPSVPLYGRRVVEEMEINGKMMPKDTTLLILPYFMARDSTLFENPLKFDPDRFVNEINSDDANIYAYVPFSGGFRNCIGQKFAMLEMKSTISKIILNFHIHVQEGFKAQDSLELVIKSKNGIMIKLSERSRK